METVLGIVLSSVMVVKIVIETVLWRRVVVMVKSISLASSVMTVTMITLMVVIRSVKLLRFVKELNLYTMVFMKVPNKHLVMKRHVSFV